MKNRTQGKTMDKAGGKDPNTAAAIRKDLKQKRARITLFRAPFSTLKYFSIVLKNHLISALWYTLEHKYATFFAVTTAIVCFILYHTPGTHQVYVTTIEYYALLAGWWVFLGILSSVGLGTGLHTFVLYLGPHIAKVTLTATECGSVNFETYGPNSFTCPINETPHEIGIFNVYQLIMLESFLWGAGTAIGELPPYFISRAARLAGETSDLDMDDDNDDDDGPKKPPSALMVKIKQFMLANLGFFGIMLFASIPNPLFDLAGLACGHFGIPFWTFFGATFIGKAIMKVNLQSFFVVTMFSVERLQWLVDAVESSIPVLQGKIKPFLESEKAKLHAGAGTTHAATEKTMVGQLWDIFLIAMVSYFVISIINSSVQQYLRDRDEAQLETTNSPKKPTAKKQTNKKGK